MAIPHKVSSLGEQSRGLFSSLLALGTLPLKFHSITPADWHKASWLNGLSRAKMTFMTKGVPVCAEMGLAAA